MNWEYKRNDFLVWTRLCYANGAVYMLSWDRVSSLWFWLSNCLVFKVIYFLYLHSVGFVRKFYHCTYSQLRNTLWVWTYHCKMCCVVCYGLKGVSGIFLFFGGEGGGEGRLIYSYCITPFHHFDIGIGSPPLPPLGV